MIYLYSILPYIDTGGAEAVDFFQGSYFADFRIPEEVERARDPFYDGVELRQWVTGLSMLGNHQSVILFDARSMRVGIYDQESTDHGMREWASNGGDQDESRTKKTG